MRKAGPDEQEMINDLISMLTEVPEENEETATPPKPDPVPVAKASEPSGQVLSATTQQGVSDQGEDVDPLSVFEAINKKAALSESPTKVITSPIASRRPSSSSGSQWQFDGFATGLKAMGYLTEEDQTIMARCSNQRPINLGSSTQLQRANKAEKQQQEEEEEEDQEEKKETTVSTKTGGKVFKPGPKKKHLTTKPKAKAKAKALPKKKKTKQGVKKTLPSSTLEPETTQAKDDTVQASSQKKKKKNDKKKNKNSEASEAKSTNSSTTPHGFDPEVTRAVNRKRFTSRAWHSAYDLAIGEGFSQEEGKQKAREASQKASQEFVGLWPLPAPTQKKTKTAEAFDAD